MANAARLALGTLLESALGSPWTVYRAPVDVVKYPAAVIVPADPYVQPDQLGSGFAWAWDVSLVVKRIMPATALGDLEDAIADVISTLPGNGYRVADASAPEPVTVSGVEGLETRIVVVAKGQR